MGLSVNLAPIYRGQVQSPKRVKWGASILPAVPMVLAGVLHQLHGPGVAKIVPGWMPWRLFWAYFTGARLIAAGISFTWSLVSFWFPGLSVWGYITGTDLLVGGVSLLLRNKRVMAAKVLGWTILAAAVIAYGLRALAGQRR